VKLQCQIGTDSIGGTDGKNYIVSNIDGTVVLPDDVAEALLATGRSGCYRIAEPPAEPAPEAKVMVRRRLNVKKE
jgi:hypothetical protein